MASILYGYFKTNKRYQQQSSQITHDGASMLAKPATIGESPREQQTK